MLNTCSCDIDVNGGEMCGMVFSTGPAVCTLHMQSISLAHGIAASSSHPQ
jgi:hypothetical protein